jgi:hypothetical protein
MKVLLKMSVSLCIVVVNFQQRNVFPVHFSGSTIEQWWGTELTFNIYFRNSSQKKVCGHLKDNKNLLSFMFYCTVTKPLCCFTQVMYL